MIVVSRQIILVYVQVVVAVQFPELAIDDIKVLVAEESHDLVDVLLVLEQSEYLTGIGMYVDFKTYLL